jgi:hypothetical protein
MASTSLLGLAAVMGVVLVVAAAGVARLRRRDSYRPTFGDIAPDDGSALSSDAAALAATVLVVAVVAAAVVLENAVLVFGAVVPGLLFAYFGWGVYHMARSRGLPRAHSVGLSAWLVGVLLVGVVATNLVLG